MRTPWLASTLLALGATLSCSVLNAPGELLADGSGGETSTGGVGGTGGDGSGGDGSGGDGGAGTGGGGVAAPTTGLVVLGAEDGDGTRVVSVLAAHNGQELHREPLPVAAIAYDEAPGRYVWFVFTSASFPASPTGVADLEVRLFDDATRQWSVLSTTPALAPPRPDQLVVLNDRLIYLSHRVVSGSAVPAVTVLDTSDLENVTELTTRTAEAGESYVGLAGQRGTEVNPDVAGGRVRLMIARDCTEADCALVAQQLFVGNGLTDGTSATVDRFVGVPAFSRARLEDKLFVATRSTTPTDRVVVRSFEGSDLSSPTVLPISDFEGDDVAGFGLLECLNAGLLTDRKGSRLIGVHLISGQLRTVELEHPGAAVYAEPFGGSAIALNPEGAPGVRSFEVSRSGATNLAINPRSAWQPPDDLKPQTGATRRPESAECP